MIVLSEDLKAKLRSEVADRVGMDADCGHEAAEKVKLALGVVLEVLEEDSQDTDTIVCYVEQCQNHGGGTKCVNGFIRIKEEGGVASCVRQVLP